MQAILTKYIPCTNLRGSRIKAECEAGTLIIGYPYNLTTDAAHQYAARLLAEKLEKEIAARQKREVIPGKGWLKPFVSGGLPKNKGYAHVFVV
jgi:hypothetical protein